MLTLKPVSWADTSLLNVPSHQAQQGEQSIGVLSPKEWHPPPYASLRTFGSPDSGPRPITESRCAVDSRGCPALGPPVLVSAPSLCRVLPFTGNCSRQRVLTLSPVQPAHLPLLRHQQHASTVASPSAPSAATLTLRVPPFLPPLPGGWVHSYCTQGTDSHVFTSAQDALSTWMPHLCAQASVPCLPQPTHTCFPELRPAPGFGVTL